MESQEALRLRMREVELRIAALLGEEEDAEEQQQPGRQQAAAQPSKQQQVQAAAGQAAGQGESYTAAEQRRMQPKMVYWESTGPVQPIVGRQAAVPGGGGAAPGELRLVAAGVSMPHPAKAATGGEDAFFVSSWGQGAVGVADGVGGWAAEGVNPALYPRRLMEACEEALAPSGRGLLDGEPCCQQPRCRDKPPSSSGSGDGSSSTDGEQAAPAGPPPGAALTVLQSAHQRTSEPGSCTVILALLQPSGQLSVANLGDTELRVVRGGRIAFKTKVGARACSTRLGLHGWVWCCAQRWRVSSPQASLPRLAGAGRGCGGLCATAPDHAAMQSMYGGTRAPCHHRDCRMLAATPATACRRRRSTCGTCRCS